jgi:hypothetical protein
MVFTSKRFRPRLTRNGPLCWSRIHDNLSTGAIGTYSSWTKVFVMRCNRTKKGPKCPHSVHHQNTGSLLLISRLSTLTIHISKSLSKKFQFFRTPISASNNFTKSVVVVHRTGMLHLGVFCRFSRPQENYSP